jgi:predicted RND superfamily exporter protein
VTRRLADLIFRFRYLLCGLILLGFVVLLPKTNFTEIDNDISMWISKADPVYQTYDRFRREFGGQRTLLVALKSDRLFTTDSL